ncbi:MAG: glycosyltransferase family 4 protein [Flavobacteriaceae bacterium]|nr:glycosyltransferase family 4 protein [Flavobacteriaceae bacterium]
MIKVCLLTNMPVPYREKVHEFVAENLRAEYTVVYFSKMESNRQWDFNQGNYKYNILKSSEFRFRKRIIHINFNIYKELNSLNPDVLIVSGLGPTSLLAVFWAKIKNKKIIPFTDAFLLSESSLKLNKIQIYLRRKIYSTSKACIGASKGSIEMFRYYGAKSKNIFQSHLCIDNKYFFETYKSYKTSLKRDFDLIYSGRLTDDKNIDFFTQVIVELKKKKPNLSVLIIGSGPAEKKVVKKLRDVNVSFNFPGFIDQKDLPKYYMKAKLLLLPTKRDAWGLVCNEASAVGTPVVTTKYAGAANDLVIHKITGLVLELDLNLWVEEVNKLLLDKNKLEELSKNAMERVQNYNFKNASQGIIDAVNNVINKN